MNNPSLVSIVGNVRNHNHKSKPCNHENELRHIEYQSVSGELYNVKKEIEVIKSALAQITRRLDTMNGNAEVSDDDNENDKENEILAIPPEKDIRQALSQMDVRVEAIISRLPKLANIK